MWDIVLSKQREVSLSRQLFYQIKNLILADKLKAGEALPSSRSLAKDMSVSRSTVNEAYDMLLAEGFVTSRQGSRVRVKEGLCLEASSVRVYTEETPRESRTFSVDFQTGQPDIRSFPHYLWRQMLLTAYDKLQDDHFGYSETAGYGPLREEICQWLFRTRGISTDPRNLFITSGTTHAITILAPLLVKKGLPFAIEDPCHHGIIEILKHRGISYAGVPVDDQGLRTELLREGRYSAVYVTPSHQFPLGGILPAERRAELIRLARKQGMYIIEDDYDSEFRYGGAPISPLYSMDSERVLYAGTFSKTMFPALRVGFVILPSELHAPWLHGRLYTDVQNPIMEQAALAEFLNKRKLDRYLQQLGQQYADKRRVLSESISRYFGSGAIFHGDQSGLHLVLQLPGLHFDEEFLAKSQSVGIRAIPVESYCLVKGKHQDKIMLGYGHLNMDEIENKVERFYHFISQHYGPSKG
ncbi:MocR-like pyridoxine biosynthesis transcription factor PdxR [Gorillibacterium timonense]|uniref:MocR-like pyridoxine biosynthesis transcription factor PdxR n=1 Tax=Gorillibacterium timonense TaxID=1689269 RepID=UPI00071DC7B8|nr:PLP-dependent aminotransferase family protein [Gorillibacterium timonense]